MMSKNTFLALTGIFVLVFAVAFIVSLLAVIDFRLSPYAVQENFNLEIELPDTFEHIHAGEELWFTVRSLNLANEERIDITLRYDILNTARESIVSKSETVAIETQASFVNSFTLPEDIVPGTYNLRVALVSADGGSIAAATERSFVVAAEDSVDRRIYYYGGILVLFAFVFVYIIFKGKTIAHRIKIRTHVRSIVRKRMH